MTRLLALAPLLALLAGCGGMTSAVGVLPNTTNDLARKTEPFRAGRKDEPQRVSVPTGGF